MKRRKNETMEEFRIRNAEYMRNYKAKHPEAVKKSNDKTNANRTKQIKHFSCDFETTVPKEEDEIKSTRVWLWGAVQVVEKGKYKPEHKFHGTTIESFFDFVLSHKGYSFSFHNLKFDGNFIMWYALYKGGFKSWHVTDREGRTPEYDGIHTKYISYTIASTGQWYNLELMVFDKKKKVWDVYPFRDSLKLINASVAQISKDFKCSSPKGECDYLAERPEGYEPTEEEIDYCLTDCQIIAEALFELHSMNIEGMTIASVAKRMAFKMVDENAKKVSDKVEYLFPKLELDVDAYIRQSYKGGFTYVNPYFQNVEINRKGFVLDVNSMYPAVMEQKPLPFGEPVYFEGSYEDFRKKGLCSYGPQGWVRNTCKFKFYFQRCEIMATLKEGGIPFVQAKKAMFNHDATYTAKPQGEYVFALPDIISLYENYDVTYFKPIDGYAFQERIGVLTPYIEKFAEIKRNEPKGAKRTSAKLLINAIYGKFGSSPIKEGKNVDVDDKHGTNVCLFTDAGNNEPLQSNTVYIPFASAVTAWARRILFEAIHAFGMRKFAYCDTDSVHVIADPSEIPDTIDLDPKKFGAWDLEDTFNKAKYLHTKCYIEQMLDGDGNVKGISRHVAGLPANLCKKVTFENFKEGLSIFGKLSPRVIVGGVYLKETLFTIKPIKEAVLEYDFEGVYTE